MLFQRIEYRPTVAGTVDEQRQTAEEHVVSAGIPSNKRAESERILAISMAG